MKKTTVALIIAAFLTALGLTPSVSAPVGDWASDFLVTSAHSMSLYSLGSERVVGEASISPSRLRSLDECLLRCSARDRLCCEAQSTNVASNGHVS
jgi:hypothetical protein